MINKNFLIILIGQVISILGSAIQRFSLSLYLLEFTGSAGIFANILALSTLPYILFAPIAGRLSDQMNRKKIMVVLDFICAGVMTVYAVILFAGKDQPGIVGTVMFILSICAALYGPAVSASIPQIVDEMHLTSANGMINQVGSIVNFAGPIIAGILYGLVGIKLIVIINAVSFLISAIMELFLDIPDVVKRETDALEEKLPSLKRNFIVQSFNDMKAHFLYLKRKKKVVLGIIVSYALCNIFVVPILSIAAPYFINIQLGLSAEIYGLVEGICVFGMLLGGLWISLKPNHFSIKKVHYTYFPMLAGAVMMAVLGFLKLSAYVSAGLFALSGMAIMLSLALSNVLTLTYMQKEIPKERLGGISAFSTAIATVSVAPGQILFGQAIEWGLSVSVLLVIVAGINLLFVKFVKWNVRTISFS